MHLVLHRWLLLRWLLNEWVLLRWLFLGWLLLIFSLSKFPLGETGCLSNLCFLLIGCLCTHFFDSPLFSQHSSLSYFWLPTPHCPALVWLTGCHTIPFITKCFPSNTYLGKQRISPGVAIILSIYLCSHTQLDRK